MYDLDARASLPLAAHRRLAPMPDAALFRLSGDGLDDCDATAPRASLSPPLLAQLRATGEHGQTFGVAADDGLAWRLRRHACEEGSLWRFQSLAHSRCRLLERLRGGLAPRLAAQVLHDLRNPMNALTLHADLLTRTLPKADDPVQRGRAEASVQVIKSRLADLGQRQESMVSLWLMLAGPDDRLSAPAMGAAFEQALQLLRGVFALNNVILKVEGLDLLVAAAPRPATQAVALAVIALMMVACEAAAAAPHAGIAEAMLAVGDAPEGVRIDIGPAVPAAGLMDLLGAGSGVAALAGLALLLEDDGVRLEQATPNGPVRLLIGTQE